jgi:hypothetical protein
MNWRFAPVLVVALMVAMPVPRIHAPNSYVVFALTAGTDWVMVFQPVCRPCRLACNERAPVWIFAGSDVAALAGTVMPQAATATSALAAASMWILFISAPRH